jgi:hypothetical protein
MDAPRLIARLDSFAAALPAAVAVVSDSDARFKSPSGAWSILEIVNHLVDEEVLDFRARLESVLRDPAAALAPIDPEGWARDRRYQERDLAQSVARFVEERRRSVAWLRSLKDPDWSRAYQHAKFGPLSAGMFLGAWAAHDALHLRQIAKRIYELVGRDSQPYSVRYAGEWGV